MDNQYFYLYNATATNLGWWTMTPSGWDGDGDVRTIFVTNAGRISGNLLNVSYGVRPVINLKADTLVTGRGTSTSPYEPIYLKL